jgi:hypothetical protein
MADNELDVITAGGATKTLRSRDVGSQVQAQKVDVGPWVPTLVAGHQYSLDVTTGAVVTLTVPSGATHALITVEDADVRFREDAADPTTGATGSGMVLPAGFIGELALPNALRFIAVTATAELNVSYRKYV